MALRSFQRGFNMTSMANTRRDDSAQHRFYLPGQYEPCFCRLLTDTEQGGCFFGALFAFLFAEKIGRKKTIVLVFFVLLLGGTLISASRGSLNISYGGSAVAGLGIGASSMVVLVCISETAPPSIRGASLVSLR